MLLGCALHSQKYIFSQRMIDYRHSIGWQEITIPVLCLSLKLHRAQTGRWRAQADKRRRRYLKHLLWWNCGGGWTRHIFPRFRGPPRDQVLCLFPAWLKRTAQTSVYGGLAESPAHYRK